MRRMSDVFGLPVTATNLVHVANETTLDDDKAVIHAINHVDALADALELLLSDKAIFKIDNKNHAQAVSALVDYRGDE